MRGFEFLWVAELAATNLERAMAADARVIEATLPEEGAWRFSDVRADEFEPPVYHTRVAGKSGFELIVADTRADGRLLMRSVSFRFSPTAEWQRAIALFTMAEGYELEPDAGLALRDSEWVGTDAELRLVAEAIRAFVRDQSSGRSDFKNVVVQRVSVIP